MSRHFPQIEEIHEWTNEYTGLTFRPAEGAEGERQGTFSSSKEGIARRNAFFNPSRVKIVRESEEKEAELIPREELSRTFKFHLPGQATTAALTPQLAEPEQLLENKRPLSLNSNKTGKNISRDITKQSHDVLSSQDNVATLKNPLLNSIDIKRFGVTKKASSLHDPNFLNDYEGRTSLALSSLKADSGHDVHRLDDLVIDILSHKVGESRLAQSCAELAMKMALEAKESHQNTNGDAAASTTVDYTSTDRLEAPYVPQMSSDIIFAIQKAKKDWKTDDLEQIRTGSWAIDVAKKNLGPVTQESLKPDALKALGRLALQSLHLASADQKFDVHLNDDAENDRLTVDFSSFKERIKQIANLKDLMKEESFRQDLQALQDGLLLEKSADEVVESFLETLRDEIVDEHSAALRKDILIGASSSATSDTKFVQEIGENTKVSRKVLDSGGEKIGKVHFKNDAETGISSRKTFDSAAKEVVQTTDRSVPSRQGFAILETDAEELTKHTYKSSY